MMDNSLDWTTIDIIRQLEARLQTISYVTSGHLDGTIREKGNRSAVIRLRDLKQSLDQLVLKSRVIQDLLKIHARHSDFFHNSEPLDALSSLDTASKSSIVLAAASSLHQTASSLTSVKDTQLPAAETSTQLIDAAARTAEVELLQESQLLEISALKKRSAAVLQRWYSVDILQGGELWADLEARFELLEQTVRRAEAAKQHLEGLI